MAGIIKTILTTGQCYFEEVGVHTTNTIRNKIYQSLSYLRENNERFVDVMGHIEVKCLHNGWRINALPGERIRPQNLDTELQEFLDTGTGTFERYGLLLSYEEKTTLRESLPQNTVSQINGSTIFIKFI